jgi:hypothetical protein
MILSYLLDNFKKIDTNIKLHKLKQRMLNGHHLLARMR